MQPTTILLALSTAFAVANGQQYLVVTPDVLRLGVEHKVVVSVYNVGSDIPVEVTVERESGETLFSAPTVSASAGAASEVAIEVTEAAIGRLSTPRYLVIRAKSSSPSLTFDTRKRVVVTLKSLMAFVQTDKPIYVRDDTVYIRVVVVTCCLVPVINSEVILLVKNPKNVTTLREKVQLSSNYVIKRAEIELGPDPLEGTWTIRVRYGINKDLSSDFFFEVKDYVLPRFDVAISPPEHVTGTDQFIRYRVTSKYTYGKGVVGSMTAKLGVWDDDTGNVTIFHQGRFTLSAGENGVKDFAVPNRGYGVFPANQKLWIYASVRERASGIKYNITDLTTRFTDSKYVIECMMPQYYKPNLPVSGAVKVRYQSGNPAANLQIELTNPSNQISVVSTDESGVAAVDFSTTGLSGELELTVGVPPEQGITQCIVLPFSLPCGSSHAVTIESSSPGILATGQNNIVLLQSSVNPERVPVTVLVLSCGTIQLSISTVTQVSERTSVSIDILPKWSKKISLVIYYYDSRCSSIQSDSVVLEIEDAFANELVVEPQRNSVEPGADLDLRISAARHSDVALLAVDSGLYILNNEHRLDREKVLNEKLSHDISCPIQSLDSAGVFKSHGLALMTNVGLSIANREKETCESRKKRSNLNVENEECCKELGELIRDSVLSEASSGNQFDCSNVDYSNEMLKSLVAFCQSKKDSTDFLNKLDSCPTKRCKPTKQGNQAFISACVPSCLRQRTSEADGSIIADGQIVVQRRTYFPHAWLVEEEFNTGSSGGISKTVTVPDSITDWVIHGIAVSKDGFAVAKTTTVTVFKSIFVECHLPFSVRRQEQISLACTAYNYGIEDVDVIIRLVDTPKNVCTTAGIGKLTKPLRLNIKAQGTTTVLFPMVPLAVGQTEISVRLLTLGFNVADEIVKAVKVIYEGVKKRYSYSAELDPAGINSDKGQTCAAEPAPTVADNNPKDRCYKKSRRGMCDDPFPELQTKEECCRFRGCYLELAWGPFCDSCPVKSEMISTSGQRNYFKTRVPNNYIQGSGSAWISVSGKYLQGTITFVTDVRQLLKNERGGCGEENMIRFAPNVVILQYLDATGRLTDADKALASQTLRMSLDTQLKFRTRDGGYALWPQFVTATWLTAFVLQTVCRATNFIYVDPVIITDAQNFLLTRQDPDTGEFNELGGTVRDTLRGAHRVTAESRTATVVIAMLECCDRPDYPYSEDIKLDVCAAVGFLERQIRADSVAHDHTEAMIFYALALACHKCRNCNCSADILDLIKARMCGKSHVANGARFWNDKDGNSVTSEAVEITSYMLCGYIASGDFEGSRPLAKRINSIRNSQGSFNSAQDTYAALKCMGDFARNLKVQRALSVKVTSLCDATFSHTFTVDESNRDVNQKIEIPVRDIVKVETSGAGLGLAQIEVSYNLPLAEDEVCAFDLNVTATTVEFNRLPRDKELHITACARYLQKETLGLTLIEVEIPTGYEACENLDGDPLCLKQLMDTRGRELGLTNYDVSERSAIFYFVMIPDNESLCVTFKAVEKYAVENTSPVTARVYDYYEPDVQCTIFYSPDNANAQLGLLGCDAHDNENPICICGAGYCPTLEPIKNRMCNACNYHEFAWKVRLAKIMTENTWLKLRLVIEEIIKPGVRSHVVGDRVIVWMQEICRLSAQLEESKRYHVMGKDGPKIILDHNSHIEEWPDKLPPPSPRCVKQKTKNCVKSNCRPLSGARLRKCEARVLPKCQELSKKECVTGLEAYVKAMRQGSSCDRPDLCN